MKKILNYLVIFFIGCTFVSCSDFLNENPSHIGTSDTYFTTAKGFDGAVNACYQQLRTIHNNKSIWLHGTDQYQRSGFYPQKNTNYNQFNDYSPTALNSESTVILNFWNNVWIAINRCNTVLGVADKVEVNDITKNKRLAEVKTLRALYYYYLVDQFGDIPFPLKPYEELQITAERVSEEIIYGQLIKDLEECIVVLPDSPDDYGRISKGAASFLLSKLYLTRGYKSYKQKDDFQNAAKYADNLINSGTYKLLPEFHKIFLPGNEKNDEIIFAIQWSNDLLLNEVGNNIHSKFGFYYDQAPGTVRSNYYNRSQRIYCETFYLVDCFGVDTLFNKGKTYTVPAKMEGMTTMPPPEYSYKMDKRYNATFRRLYMVEKTTLNFKKTYGTERVKTWNLYARPGSQNGETTPLVFSGNEEHLNVNYWQGTGRDTALYIPAPDEAKDWPKERWESVPYSVVNHQYWNLDTFWGIATCAPSTTGKFWEPQSGYNDNKGIRDMFLFRLGEAYLLAAEAYLQAGDINQAVNRINRLRRRAYGVNIDTASPMDIKSADLDIDFILDERTRELAGEENRWTELKRTGKLVERVLKYNLFAGSDYIQGGPYIKEFHNLRPIPYDWISVLQNKVAQNPGY